MTFVRDNKAVDLHQMIAELHYDIPDFRKNDTVNYLLTRKILIKIATQSNKYKLSDIGIDLLNQLESESKQEKELRELEVENLRLQNDKAKYEITLRRQQEEISSLTAKNLRLQNNNLKRTIIVAIITGLTVFITTNWQWTLSAIHKIFQK